MNKFIVALITVVFFFCGKTKPTTIKNHTKKIKMVKTKENILKELDKVFNDMYSNYNSIRGTSDIKFNFFLDLEHGYSETAGSKIHLFGDKENWAIVFEKVGYSTRGGQIESELNFVGNCVNYKNENNDLTNTEYISLISANELERIEMPENEDGDFFEMVNPKIKEVKVRGEFIPIETNQYEYLKRNIKLVDSDNPNGYVNFGNLARYIYSTQPMKLCATPEELKTMLPKNIPYLMTIDKFHFESSYEKKNIPSSQETYNLIADILVSLNKSLWKPKEKPNNEWYNWESGNL